MDRIRIRGGNPLEGEIRISGAKNAALPLMVACLLSDEPLKLLNIPHLADITQLASLLAQLGVQINMSGETGHEAEAGRVLTLTARQITNTTAPYEIVRKMRASFLVSGPLLARCGRAKVSLPGGCAIGDRPVDLHLMVLEALGAQITLDDGYVIAEAPHGLKGARIDFPIVSVGATENALMAASLAQGDTLITNAACEPEIVDLGRCLVAMGARIEGLGTSKIRVSGKDKLRSATHRVLPDRIETGTYALAPAIAGGRIKLVGTSLSSIMSLVPILRALDVEVIKMEDGLVISGNGQQRGSVEVKTAPYPGFPTDLQAQLMALLCTVPGRSEITETIFENRFMHVPELNRMGARISVNGQVATIEGVKSLTGAPVMATDLRASVSLVLAGLAAKGETIVHRIYHLDRGFERIEEKLGKCGADIVRLKD